MLRCSLGGIAYKLMSCLLTGSGSSLQFRTVSGCYLSGARVITVADFLV